MTIFAKLLLGVSARPATRTRGVIGPRPIAFLLLATLAGSTAPRAAGAEA